MYWPGWTSASGAKKSSWPAWASSIFASRLRPWRRRSSPPSAPNIPLSKRRKNRARSSLISVRRTSPSQCTSATFARRSLAIVSRARCGCLGITSSRTITLAIGEPSLGCCWSAGRLYLIGKHWRPIRSARWIGFTKSSARSATLKSPASISPHSTVPAPNS